MCHTDLLTGGRGIFSKSEAINNGEALEDTESSRALQRAKAFSSESDNPWFYREMRPTYLQKYVLVTITSYIMICHLCLITNVFL